MRLLLLISFILNYCYGQNLNFQKNKFFSNDIGTLSVLDNKKMVITTYIQKNDSTILIKKSYALSGKYFHVYEIDKNGFFNGENYYLDTIKQQTTHSFMEKSKLIYSYTLDSRNDTIKSEVRKGDSYIHTLVEDTIIKKWTTNENGLKNGEYLVLNRKNNFVYQKIEYTIIRTEQIKNRKLFLEEKKELNLGNLISEFESIPMTETKYNEKGKAVYYKKHKWKSLI